MEPSSERRLFRLAERPRKFRPGLFFLWARLGPPGTSQSRDIKYIGMDVHKEAIVIVVLNGRGKVVMETVVGTKASCILQVIHGLRGELHVSWEEGTWAAWLHDLLQPHMHQVLVYNPRRNAMLGYRQG